MAHHRPAAIGGGIAVVAIAAGILVWRAMPDASKPPAADEVHALAEAACPRVTAAFFYRVDKDGKTSYLLGTRHAGVALAKFPPGVERAFRSARTAVFESIAHGVFQEAPGIAIDEALGSALWDRYRELVGDDTAARLQHRTPLEAASALILLYEDTTQAIDRELEQRARAAHKELVGLEDGERTAQVGDEILGIDQLRKFVGAVSDRSLLAGMTRTGLEAYCKGKTHNDGFEGVVARSTSERTRAWIPKLDEIFAGGDAFVTVGVMHVIDRGGLIELLRARGYTVTHVD